MVGIIFLIFMIVANTILVFQKAADNKSWNESSRKMAEKQGRDSYILCDHQTFYDMKTGKTFRYHIDENGDRWKVKPNGDPIENLSETERNKKKEEAVKKSGNSRFYVESVGFDFDEKRELRHMREQKSKCLVRVRDKETGIDYFRVQNGHAYYYQNLDTGKFDFAEVMPKYKNDEEILLTIKETQYGDPTICANNEENLQKSREYLNKAKEVDIKHAMEKTWHTDRQRALNWDTSIWGTANDYWLRLNDQIKK